MSLFKGGGVTLPFVLCISATLPSTPCDVAQGSVKMALDSEEDKTWYAFGAALASQTDQFKQVQRRGLGRRIRVRLRRPFQLTDASFLNTTLPSSPQALRYALGNP